MSLRGCLLPALLSSVASLSLCACSSSSDSATAADPSQPDAGPIQFEDPDTGSPQDSAAADVTVADSATPQDSGAASKAANCAKDFGDDLPNDFLRVDGTIVAIVGTKDSQCTLPNKDHVVIQVKINGKVYRMVASVLSTRGDPDVAYLTKNAPLVGPAWAEGWHTGIAFDYVTNLGVHSKDFTPHPMLELEKLSVDDLEIGAKISIFASNEVANPDYNSSAHLIHRNKTNRDGAIVVNPESANPKYQLFSFQNQSF